MELTRTEVLSGNYSFPQDFLHLKPTSHFIKRLEERGIGVDFMPTMARITKNNIHSAKTEDGKNLTSMVIRLNYSSTKFVFLVIAADGGLKTLWFRDKKKKGL